MSPVRKQGYTQVVVVDSGRVVRYKRDQVGNDLTTHLAWCSTHSEPVWIYSDGSYTCPYDLVIEARTDHVIGVAPWERDQ